MTNEERRARRRARELRVRLGLGDEVPEEEVLESFEVLRTFSLKWEEGRAAALEGRSLLDVMALFDETCSLIKKIPSERLATRLANMTADEIAAAKPVIAAELKRRLDSGEPI